MIIKFKVYSIVFLFYFLLILVSLFQLPNSVQACSSEDIYAECDNSNGRCKVCLAPCKDSNGNITGWETCGGPTCVKGCGGGGPGPGPTSPPGATATPIPPPTATPAPTDPLPIGYYDADYWTADCRVSGWTCDPSNYGASVPVNVYVDGTTPSNLVVISATASTVHTPADPGPNNQCGGTAHDFEISNNDVRTALINAGLDPNVQHRYRPLAVNIDSSGNTRAQDANGNWLTTWLTKYMSDTATCLAPVNGVCGATHYNCDAGTSAPGSDTDSAWIWTCNGSNGGSNASCSENKPPTCSISASPSGIAYNGTSTISWSSTNTTGCTVSSPGWTGTSGSQNTGALLSTTAYDLSCPGVDGSTCTGPTIVTVDAPPPPTLTCTAYTNPASITWDWTTSSGPLSYWLQVWDDVWKANEWHSGPTVTTTATPGIPYYGHVLAGDGSQSSPWSSPLTSCTVPLPSAPTGTCGVFNTTNATTPITWTWASGTGLQSKDNSFSLGGTWWYNDSATSPLTIPGIRPGPPEVCARTTYDFGTFSSESCITCPLPANQQTIVSGVLRQKSGSGCYLANGSHNFKISSISATTPDNCVTAACSSSPNSTNATTYSCTVTYDNQACVSQGRQPNPSQTLTLNITTSNGGYDAGQFSDSSCNLSGKQLSINEGVDNLSAGVAFNFNGDKWLKTKDTSFNASSTTAVSIPIFTNAFPASNDTGSPYFIIDQAGSALKAGISPDTAYSTPNNWHDSSYPAGLLSINPSAFLSYVKSRKENQSISDLANINADGIYVWTGGTLTISDLAKFNPYNVVLISNGEIIIDKEPFKSSKSLAIVANTITFTNSVHKATGIFIANTVNTGNPANQGLQIVGNLIALSTLNNGRSWSDTSIPSIFVEFDPSQYVTLLPYLSTASYQWKQIQ